MRRFWIASLGLGLFFLIPPLELFSQVEAVLISPETRPGDGDFWRSRDIQTANFAIRTFRKKNESINRFEILADRKFPLHGYEDLASGHYIIQNGTITEFILDRGHTDIDNLILDQNVRLFHSKDDIAQKYYLEFEKSKFQIWCFGDFYQRGDKRTVNGIPIVIVDQGGSIDSDTYTVRVPFIDDGLTDKKTDEMDLLHKGKRITIYARTEKKFKFVNSEMFFYLIQGYFKSPVINNGYISYAWIPASGAKYDLIVPEEGESYYPTGFPYE